MKSFFDLQYEAPQSVENYLPTIESYVKRCMAEDILSIANPIFDLIYRIHGGPKEAPLLRIKNNPAIGAGTIEGMIVLNSGLIEHCLCTTFPNIDEVLGTLSLSKVLKPNHVHSIAIGWVVAHEQFHVIRKHSDAISEVGDSRDARLAVEFDADLCATTLIFRLVQLWYPSGLSDLDLRRVTLYAIFWSLRTMALPESQETHLPLESRLMSIILKLIQVPTSLTERLDYDLSKAQPWQDSLLKQLMHAVGKFESYLQGMPKTHYHRINFLDHWIEMTLGEKSGQWVEPAYGWDKIRGVVERLTKANIGPEEREIPIINPNGPNIPRTNICAEIDGVFRSLLTVTSKKNGGQLLLTTRLGDTFSIGVSNNVPLKARRILIHEPTKGAITTITEKIWLVDGSRQTIVTHVEPEEGFLLWPIFTKRLGVIDSNSGVYKKKESARELPVTYFNQKSATLFYTVMVASNSFDPRGMNLGSASAHCIAFAKYTIILIISYLNIPTAFLGAELCLNTRDDVNGVEPGPRAINQSSMSVDYFEKFYRRKMELLRGIYVKGLLEFMGDKQVEEICRAISKEEFLRRITIFTSVPISRKNHTDFAPGLPISMNDKGESIQVNSGKTTVLCSYSARYVSAWRKEGVTDEEIKTRLESF